MPCPRYLLEYRTIQTYLMHKGEMLHNFWKKFYDSHIFGGHLVVEFKVLKVGRRYTGDFFKLGG